MNLYQLIVSIVVSPLWLLYVACVLPHSSYKCQYLYFDGSSPNHFPVPRQSSFDMSSWSLGLCLQNYGSKRLHEEPLFFTSTNCYFRSVAASLTRCSKVSTEIINLLLRPKTSAATMRRKGVGPSHGQTAVYYGRSMRTVRELFFCVSGAGCTMCRIS